MLPSDGPSNEESLAILNSIPEMAALPCLALADYRTLAARVSPPTEDQMRDFASHVANAKSWYKHLPLRPPGVPFQFFIDPWAGLDRVRVREGGIVYGERTQHTTRFHYTWMTTQEYRSRFGFLAFSASAGSLLYLDVRCRTPDGKDLGGMLDNNPCRPSVAVPHWGEFRLPQAVLDSGTIDLTAVIHPQAAVPPVCLASLGSAEPPGSWPAESGGSTTLEKILARCRSLEAQYEREPSDENRRRLSVVDEELDQLFAPERRRLHERMVLAMRRVVAIVIGKGP
jgi:hypothetical protein